MGNGKALRILFGAGRLLSPWYGLAMRLRAYMYQNGMVLKTRRLPVPVISIGNLTLGGTGKTPMTQLVVRLLLAQGRRPLVVSRGYGGKARGAANIVSDGSSVLMSPDEAGDEPCLLAETLPDVPVVVGRNRYEAGRLALRRFSADVIVLDDAFQHLGVGRDFDVVLFSSASFLGNGRVFPGGPLREPLSALGRADVFVVTGPSDEEQAAIARCREDLRRRFPGIPSFAGLYQPESGLVGANGKGWADNRPRVYGFAGIANPAAFRDTLVRAGYPVCGFQGFPDHYRYSAADLAELAAKARALGAEVLVTTRKDSVKLEGCSVGLPLLSLRVDLQVDDGFAALLARRLG